MTLSNARKLLARLIPAVLAAAIVLTSTEPGNGVARAQQGEQSLQLTTPGRQKSGGSVLELPATRRQEVEPPRLPQLTPQQGQELEIPSRQLRSQVGYTQVTVTVTNPNGGYVTGLTKDDFRVYENGQQRPVEFLRQDLNTPVSVGILVDTSGSMQPKIQQARTAIAQFLRDLNERDDVFLFAFSDRPFLLQPFTSDHSLVMNRLGLLHAYGRTALYDVLLDGLLMVQRGRYDKKAILVVTDGMDTASRSSMNQVIAQARRMGVLVYSIGIGDPSSSSAPGLSISLGPLIFGGGGDLDRVDAQTLQMLSSETGAKTFIVREVGDGEALRNATASISQELRQQYTVGFLSPDPERGGYRNLRVETPSHPGDTVRVRKGVTVGEGAESAAAR
jgi:Ca-activated chloride channel family protein